MSTSTPPLPPPIIVDGAVEKMLMESKITATNHRLSVCEGWSTTVAHLCPNVDPKQWRQLSYHMRSSRAQCALVLAHAQESSDHHRTLMHTMSRRQCAYDDPFIHRFCPAFSYILHVIPYSLFFFFHSPVPPNLGVSGSMTS